MSRDDPAYRCEEKGQESQTGDGHIAGGFDGSPAATMTLVGVPVHRACGTGVIISNGQDLERSRRRIGVLRRLLEAVESSSLQESDYPNLRLALGIEGSRTLPKTGEIITELRSRLREVEIAVEDAEAGVFTGK